MQALFDYIVKPIGGRYNNSIDVDGSELLLNTEISNHQYVNRKAEIIALPKNTKSNLKVGDTIVVHHNIFRRWYNIRGEEKNSRSYYKDGTYIIKEDQIFLYKRNDKWKPLKGYCFIQPIKSIDDFDESKERPFLKMLLLLKS